MKTLLLALVGAIAAPALVDGGRRPTQLELLRGYVNGRCLAALYAGTDAGRDADRAAEIYREVSRKSRMSVYEAADVLAKDTVKMLPSRGSAPGIGVMVCLELAQSAAVADVARGRRISHPFSARSDGRDDSSP